VNPIWHALRRHRALALWSILVPGVGIGVTTAMWNLVDVLLFRPLAAVTRPDRIVTVPPITNFVEFQQLRSALHTLIPAAYKRLSLTAGTSGQTFVLRAECVTSNYFDVLGTKTTIGRTFRVDEAEGTDAAAVISDGLWQRLFARDSDLARLAIPVENRTLKVIGVAPRGFTGEDLNAVDVWLPLTGAPELCSPLFGRSLLASDSARWLSGIARVRDPFTIGQAESELRSSVAVLQDPIEPDPTRLVLQPISGSRRAHLSRENRVAVWSAVGAIIVLLLAFADIATLMMLRALDRRIELAVRLQLGASRIRVLWSLVVEHLILASFCGVVAAIVALWMDGILTRYFPALPSQRLDGRSVAILICILCVAVIIGCAAAGLESLRADAADVLRTGDRAVRGRSRARSALIIAQIAIAQVLLVATVCFLRSVQTLMSDPGFDLNRVVIASVDLDPNRVNGTNGWRLANEALQRLVHIPSVISASASSGTLLGSPGWTVVMGAGSSPSEPFKPTVTVNAVTPDYFRTLGTPIVRGRAFSSADVTGSALVAIVDELLATRIAPGRNPIGQCVYLGTRPSCLEVVGVTKTRRASYLLEQHEELFLPATQVGFLRLGISPKTLVVRTDRSGPGLVPEVVATLHSVAPQVPVANVRPLIDLADDETRSWRLGALTFRLFGVIAGFLAVAGLYGTLAMTVRQRTPELAVRMALGATPAMILRLVAGGALGVIGLGWILGVFLTFVAARSISALFFDAAPTDLSTLLLVSGFIGVVSVCGAMVPLLRATRLDPAAALRNE
jgi:putative ABC transport system permease protein